MLAIVRPHGSTSVKYPPPPILVMGTGKAAILVVDVLTDVGPVNETYI